MQKHHQTLEKETSKQPLFYVYCGIYYIYFFNHRIASLWSPLK